MILVFKLEYRSDSQVYERLFEQALLEYGRDGRIIREGHSLKLYVAADSPEELEKFAVGFTGYLPHSIFLYSNDAQIVEEMPESGYELPQRGELALPFCPKCLGRALDEKSDRYYDIFSSCDACGYGVEGEHRSYKAEIEEIAQAVQNGVAVGLETFYGRYVIGQFSPVCSSIGFDILAYDLATIGKNAVPSEYEINALASFEKPYVRLRTSKEFGETYMDISEQFIRFKLPDDMILQLLMEELHKLGIDMLFLTREEIPVNSEFSLIDPQRYIEPIEVVTSGANVAIVSGEKGLPILPADAPDAHPTLGMFYSVIKENMLQDEEVAGLMLSREYDTDILVNGTKYGTIKYLSFNHDIRSVSDAFERISAQNDAGKKIVENYTKKFPDYVEKISSIEFDLNSPNVYALWGIVAIITGLADVSDPLTAAAVIEKNITEFLGERGPRIDYKIYSENGKTYFDPLMTIRTAMSFKLADTDPLMLSYGIVESFVEFVTGEFDDMAQGMDVGAIVSAGSLLDNKRIFDMINKEISKNHPLYFNIQLPVQGANIFYGGNSLEEE